MGCCSGADVVAGLVRSNPLRLCELRVAATNGLSPETGRGSGEWTKAAGAVEGLATGRDP